MNKKKIAKLLLDRVGEMIENDKKFYERNNLGIEYAVGAHLKCAVSAADWINMPKNVLASAMQDSLEGIEYRHNRDFEETDGKIVIKPDDEYDPAPIGGLGIEYAKEDVEKIAKNFHHFSNEIVTIIEEISKIYPMRPIDWMAMLFYFACHFGKLHEVSKEDIEEAFNINFNRVLNDDGLGILLPNSKILPEWFESEDEEEVQEESKCE